MNPTALAEVVPLIQQHEGFRGNPYECSVGAQTVGYGTIFPLTKEEALMLLRHRLEAIATELEHRQPEVADLPAGVQAALLDMAYNLGVPRLLKFRKMWAALIAGDYPTAAAEALDSRWAQQVGGRATKVAGMIRAG